MHPGCERHVTLLIGERCNLLLLNLVVGEVLLVLLPALARGGGHREGAAAAWTGDGGRAGCMMCGVCGRWSYGAAGSVWAGVDGGGG